MRDVELSYDIIEKKAYALVQGLKAFRSYVSHSPVIAYIPSNAAKTILMQPDTDGNRGIWISKILEFDQDITANKLVKGQGLAKLLAK